MKALILVLFVFIGIATSAQNHIQQRVNALSNLAALKNGQLGVVFVNTKTGAIQAQCNSEMTLIPASVQKTVTTATALKKLGPDFTFKTFLEYEGIIEDSILIGDLYIRGTGDPTLGSSRMARATKIDELVDLFADKVKRTGIKKIDGDIIGDASFFESQMANATWQWADLGNYYAGGVSGLNIHENYYELYFNKGVQGGTPSVQKTQPEMSNLVFENELISGPRSSGDNAYIYGGPYENKRFIRGSIPSGTGTFKIKGSIPNPALYFTQRLRQKLIEIGISSDSARFILKSNNQTRKYIVTFKSPKLQYIIKEANHRSVNLYCESLLKTIGKNTKKPGNYIDGKNILMDYWRSRGIGTSGIHLYDGSGLSPRNGVTATFLANILGEMATDSVYRKSIALAGRTGNLKRKFAGTKAQDKLWAKSGTMSRVCSYAGYAVVDGEEYAFALIANNFTCSGRQMRKNLDNFLISLFEK
ncbi:MAG: D-alanyl-D-alanine carboxypeptidase/D-alanyl-D-alanine-endopeptidase [Flavobacteriales bacterium]|nr:D-alanyl-D-alanine carboxypeptidase/D-alanyl-D-alanine-endopeptidase [Flavobacteriales bacterium]